jgi:hypothetical protein
MSPRFLPYKLSDMIVPLLGCTNLQKHRQHNEISSALSASNQKTTPNQASATYFAALKIRLDLEEINTLNLSPESVDKIWHSHDFGILPFGFGA